MSTNAKRPTLNEDISLAKNGEIRMPDGDIRQVGKRHAFQMVDDRERTGFYESSQIETDIIWKKKSEESDIQNETEHKKEELPDVSKPQPVITGFVRGRVAVSKTKRKPGQPRNRHDE